MSNIMTAQQSFGPAEGLIADYEWFIVLAQEKPEDDTASLSETAELIDKLFDLNPCGEEQELEEITEEPGEEKSDEEKYQEKLEAAEQKFQDQFTVDVTQSFLGLDPCDDDPVVYLRVYRNDSTIPYILELSEGTILETTIGTEIINKTIIIENSSTVNLDIPITGTADIQFQGDVITSSGVISPPNIIKSQGTSIVFSEEITATIVVVYTVTYDLLKILLPLLVELDIYAIFSDDGGVVIADVVATAYYYGLSDSTDLTVIEKEDIDDICAYSVTVVSKPTEDGADCFDRITTRELCSCSKKYIRTLSQLNPTTCPDDYSKGDIVQDITVDDYVVCPDEQDKQLSSPEYYADTCCDPPDFSLPDCRKYYRNYYGGHEIVNGVNYWREKYKDYNVIFVPISPNTGVCGDSIAINEVTPKNCCDEFTDLVWDAENSVEEITDGSSGKVYVSGGRATVTVDVRGSGFFMDPARTKRAGVVNVGSGGSIPIYTANSCGVCAVTISDGCSAVSGFIRSTEGQWVQVYRNNNGGLYGFSVDDHDSGFYTPPFDHAAELDEAIKISSLAGDYSTGTTGKYKVTQYLGLYRHAYGFFPTKAQGIVWCNNTKANILAVCSPVCDDIGRRTGNAFKQTIENSKTCGAAYGPGVPPTAYPIYAQLGFVAWYELDGEVYLFRANHVHVQYTLVWEWQC